MYFFGQKWGIFDRRTLVWKLVWTQLSSRWKCKAWLNGELWGLLLPSSLLSNSVGRGEVGRRRREEVDSRGIFGGRHTAERGKATNNKSGGGAERENWQWFVQGARKYVLFRNYFMKSLFFSFFHTVGIWSGQQSINWSSFFKPVSFPVCGGMQGRRNRTWKSGISLFHEAKPCRAETRSSCRFKKSIGQFLKTACLQALSIPYVHNKTELSL